MARYEKLGFCPNNQFVNPDIRNLKEHTNSVKVRTLLGNIPSYMVYIENSFNPKGCYITEALLTTGDLGFKLAEILYTNFRSSIGLSDNVIIWLEDCIHPGKVTGDKKLEDENFVVGITSCSHVIQIRMYKK